MYLYLTVRHLKPFFYNKKLFSAHFSFYTFLRRYITVRTRFPKSKLVQGKINKIMNM